MSEFRYNSTLAFIVVVATIIIACKKEHNISDKQQILFQYDYHNNAWGSQHNGFLIDNNGNILLYNNPKDWNYPDNLLLELTEEQVNENIKKCELSKTKIPKEELHKYTNFIRNISSSQVSAKRNISNDAGTTEFNCYQYSESTGTYKIHLIKMEGDFTCENLNFYSKKVTNWMRGIGNNIGSR